MSAMTEPATAALPRLIALLRPFRRWMLGGTLLGFLAVGSSVGLMAVSAYLISRAALVTNVAAVALAITAVRVLAISRAAFRYLERYVTHRATLRILAHLRVWFYRAIEPLAPARLEAHQPGDLLARVVHDVDTLQDFYVRVLLPPLVAVLVTLGAVLLLGVFDPGLGLVLLGFLLLAGVVLPLASRWLTRVPATATIAARARLEATLVDDIGGAGEILVFDAQDRQLARQRQREAELDAHLERLAMLRGVGAGLGGLIAGLAGIVLLGMATLLVSDGRLDGVYLAVIPLAAIAAFEAVQPLTQAVQQLDASRAAGARLFELVDAEPEPVDPPVTVPFDHAGGIAIRGLSFRYGVEEPLVLDGLDLEISPGTSLGLIGPSGSGKSTLVGLLLRFREYREGSIRLGDHELRDYAADDVRAAIGLVSQRIDLFDTSIRDNLALADAAVDDARIIEACRLVDMHEFIAGLPAGYDTRIGEDGVRLSGGERQRLAIARVLIKRAPILILDEPTANLDVDTERRVLDGLAGFMAARTTLLISHRAEVVARADHVVSLA
jgi:thiol reductant ABC exporter CydC subunit